MKSAKDERIAVRWWRGLQPYTSDGKANASADRAALARLRRADLMEAMQDPATFALFRALGRRRPAELPDVALCAATLACVREDRPEHPARILGPPSMDEMQQATIKPLRFRRLIEANPLDERLTALRRAIQLADRRVNVRELAGACLDWSEDRKQRWIFEYYASGFAAPGAEPNHREGSQA